VRRAAAVAGRTDEPVVIDAANHRNAPIVANSVNPTNAPCCNYSAPRHSAWVRVSGVKPGAKHIEMISTLGGLAER